MSLAGTRVTRERPEATGQEGFPLPTQREGLGVQRLCRLPRGGLPDHKHRPPRPQPERGRCGKGHTGKGHTTPPSTVPRAGLAVLACLMRPSP